MWVDAGVGDEVAVWDTELDEGVAWDEPEVAVAETDIGPTSFAA